MNIKSILPGAILQLTKTSPTPALDAQLLLAHVLQISRTQLYAHPERELSANEYQAWQQLLMSRVKGMPVAYLIGCREFYSRMFQVTVDTLIPRPETETLIDAVLGSLPSERARDIVDLGTGSGIIAITLQLERPDWRLTAVDNVAASLKVAKHNAKQLKAGPIEFLLGDWYQALPSRQFHAIVSNPPYVAETQAAELDGDTLCEPKCALMAGPDGLQAISHIIHCAPEFLYPSGWIFLEHGAMQADAVTRLLAEHSFTDMNTWCDLSGKPRVTAGKLS